MKIVMQSQYNCFVYSIHLCSLLCSVSNSMHTERHIAMHIIGGNGLRQFIYIYTSFNSFIRCIHLSIKWYNIKVETGLLCASVHMVFPILLLFVRLTTEGMRKIITTATDDTTCNHSSAVHHPRPPSNAGPL